MAWREIAGQRAHEELAAMVGVVLDARHHFGAAEALRVFKGGDSEDRAGAEVEETKDYGGGAEVESEAVGVQASWPVAPRTTALRRLDRPGGLSPLHLHGAAAHGVAADVADGCGWVRLAREAECAFEVLFEFGARRQAIHAIDDFDHALFALALLAAGGGHADSGGLGVIEERQFGRCREGVAVDGQRRHLMPKPVAPPIAGIDRRRPMRWRRIHRRRSRRRTSG